MNVDVSIARSADLLRVATAARRLSTSRQTVHSWIARGLLSAQVLDGQLFVAATEVERFARESEEYARFRTRRSA